MLRVEDLDGDFKGYNRNMMLEAFGIHGPIQDVKMFPSHCFIYFEERCDAESALKALSGPPRPLYGGSLSWALYSHQETFHYVIVLSSFSLHINCQSFFHLVTFKTSP